jgi:F1F0 ATPase subunit 2
MMNEWWASVQAWPPMLEILLASAAGVGLGLVFFGGLWWTVRRAAVSPQPALWFFGSLMLRMTLAMSGFYAVGGGHWARLLACLLGFAAARVLVARWTRPPAADLGPRPAEARHAA